MGIRKAVEINSHDRRDIKIEFPTMGENSRSGADMKSDIELMIQRVLLLGSRPEATSAATNLNIVADPDDRSRRIPVPVSGHEGAFRVSAPIQV